MNSQDLLNEIRQEHEQCRKAEIRLRKLLYSIIVSLTVITLVSLFNNGVLWQTTKQHSEHIETIRKNYMSEKEFL